MHCSILKGDYYLSNSDECIKLMLLIKNQFHSMFCNPCAGEEYQRVCKHQWQNTEWVKMTGNYDHRYLHLIPN